MMLPERVTLEFVHDLLTEYFEYRIAEDPEAVEFNPNDVDQQLIHEMNADIEGTNPNDQKRQGSATSYVPRSIWQALVDEDIVDEDLEDDFIAWFEKKFA